MSHEVETMAYAGAAPWHGLGKQVRQDMTPEEMLVAAGLDWTVSKRPVYVPDKPEVWNLLDPTQECDLIHCPQDFKIVRDTDNQLLGNCGSDYQPFQNHEVMRFFKRFTEAGQMSMETAGSLKGGKDIWGLAKLKDSFRLAGDDKVEGYLLLNNSHEAGKALNILFTAIRVVCNNTLTMALRHGHQRFRVVHLQMLDEEIFRAAEEALGISGKQMQEFQEQSEFLASRPAKASDVDNFIAELFMPRLLQERGKMSKEELEQAPPLNMEFRNTAQTVYEALETSPGAALESARGTWWGALSAVTYTVDHRKVEQAEGNALHSAWFGSGAAVKRKALAMATDYAGA